MEKSSVAIANGSATTEDLRFEAADLLMLAAGMVQLNGRAIATRALGNTATERAPALLKGRGGLIRR